MSYAELTPEQQEKLRRAKAASSQAPVFPRRNGEPSQITGADTSPFLHSITSAAPPASRWPEPLGAALHGLAGKFVSLVDPHTEADSPALLSQFLVAFGNEIGRAPFFAVESDRHHTNQFVAIVGETSKARKGTSWGHVRRIFAEIDPEWTENRIQGGLSSGEGVLYAVRDEGEPDKRLLVVEPEISSTLRIMGRDGNVLSTTLRQLWETGTVRVMTKNTPVKTTDAHVSLVAHGVVEEVRRYLQQTEVAGGSANRIVWICSKRSKVLPRGGGKVDFGTFSKLLRAAVEQARTAGELARDAEAETLWEEVYPELSEGSPGLVGRVTSRAEAHVMRFALLYALLDGDSAIRRVHLEAALDLWGFSEDSCRVIFGDLTGDRDEDRIIQGIKAEPGITRTGISGLFGRNRRKATLDAILSNLEKSGKAHNRREATAGRPVERWYPGVQS